MQKEGDHLLRIPADLHVARDVQRGETCNGTGGSGTNDTPKTLRNTQNAITRRIPRTTLITCVPSSLAAFGSMLVLTRRSSASFVQPSATAVINGVFSSSSKTSTSAPYEARENICYQQGIFKPCTGNGNCTFSIKHTDKRHLGSPNAYPLDEELGDEWLVQIQCGEQRETTFHFA